VTSIQSIAPRDEVRSFRVKIKNEHGVTEAEIPVEYYRNRITLAGVKFVPTEEDIEQFSEAEIGNIESAATMCHYLKSWDVEGPLYDNEGETIVSEGKVIPLDPRVTMFVPTLIIGEVMRQLTEEVFPNSKASRNERRRSR